MIGEFPEYRNRGLVRWLKAAMLKINTELGFKPSIANAHWQVEVHKVIESLRTYSDIL